MKLNLNDIARVRLTDHGKKRLDAYIEKSTHPMLSRKAIEAHMSEDGATYTFQVWDLLRLFGECCIVGHDTPFEHCEIEIVRQVGGAVHRWQSGVQLK